MALSSITKSSRRTEPICGSHCIICLTFPTINLSASLHISHLHIDSIWLASFSCEHSRRLHLQCVPVGSSFSNFQHFFFLSLWVHPFPTFLELGNSHLPIVAFSWRQLAVKLRSFFFSRGFLWRYPATRLVDATGSLFCFNLLSWRNCIHENHSENGHPDILKKQKYRDHF